MESKCEKSEEWRKREIIRSIGVRVKSAKQECEVRCVYRKGHELTVPTIKSVLEKWIIQQRTNWPIK